MRHARGLNPDPDQEVRAGTILDVHEKQIEIRRLKTEIDEQNKVIENQQKIIKELQVLNDYTQGDLIQATSDLQSRIRERNDLQLKFLDSDHETTNL